MAHDDQSTTFRLNDSQIRTVYGEENLKFPFLSLAMRDIFDVPITFYKLSTTGHYTSRDFAVTELLALHLIPDRPIYVSNMKIRPECELSRTAQSRLSEDHIKRAPLWSHSGGPLFDRMTRKGYILGGYGNLSFDRFCVKEMQKRRASSNVPSVEFDLSVFCDKYPGSRDGFDDVARAFGLPAPPSPVGRLVAIAIICERLVRNYGIKGFFERAGSAMRDCIQEKIPEMDPDEMTRSGKRSEAFTVRREDRARPVDSERRRVPGRTRRKDGPPENLSGGNTTGPATDPYADGEFLPDDLNGTEFDFFDAFPGLKGFRSPRYGEDRSAPKTDADLKAGPAPKTGTAETEKRRNRTQERARVIKVINGYLQSGLRSLKDLPSYCQSRLTESEAARVEFVLADLIDQGRVSVLDIDPDPASMEDFLKWLTVNDWIHEFWRNPDVKGRLKPIIDVIRAFRPEDRMDYITLRCALAHLDCPWNTLKVPLHVHRRSSDEILHVR